MAFLRTTYGHINMPDGDEDNDLATLLTAVEGDFDTKIVTRFQTTATRDAQSATAIAAGETGMVCYVTDRKAWCGWNGTKWLWFAHADLIHSNTGTGLLNCNWGVGTLVFDTGDLPPAGAGMRRYDIIVNGFVGIQAAPYASWVTMLIDLQGTNLSGIPGLASQWRGTINGGTGGATFLIVATCYATGTPRLQVTAAPVSDSAASTIGGYITNCTVRITDRGESSPP